MKLKKIKSKFNQFVKALMSFHNEPYDGLEAIRENFEKIVDNKIEIKVSLPHSITLCGINFPKSEKYARVKYKYSLENAYLFKSILIPIIKKEPVSIDNLPPKEEGVIWIVSRDVKEAINFFKINRPDIYSIGNTIRDKNHRIKEARALIQSEGSGDEDI